MERTTMMSVFAAALMLLSTTTFASESESGGLSELIDKLERKFAGEHDIDVSEHVDGRDSRSITSRQMTSMVSGFGVDDLTSEELWEKLFEELPENLLAMDGQLVWQNARTSTRDQLHSYPEYNCLNTAAPDGYAVVNTSDDRNRWRKKVGEECVSWEEQCDTCSSTDDKGTTTYYECNCSTVCTQTENIYRYYSQCERTQTFAYRGG